MTTTPNSRGFFTFEGVAAGSYALRIELDGFAVVERVGVPVLANSESEIGEAILLYRTHDLLLEAITDGGRVLEGWVIRARADTPSGATAPPLQVPLIENRGTLRGVGPGHYSLELLDAGGTRRWWQQVEIEPDQRELIVSLDEIAIRGLVRFGGEGVPAHLVFGGSRGVVSIPVTADEEGRFSVELPRGGRWKVDYELSGIRGTRWVRVSPSDSRAGSADLEIVLPATAVGGRVVDPAGGPAAGAKVFLFSAHELRTASTDFEGGFVFEGVDTGEAVLVARREPELESDELRVRVPESGRTGQVELALAPRFRLSGTVVSSAGAVPGAMILALPRAAAGPPRLTPAQAVSGPDGFFELAVPGAATTLRVVAMAPGFPLSTFDVPVDPDAPIVLPLDQESGELVVRPGISESESAPGSLFLFRDGFPLDHITLGLWSTRNGVRPSDAELRVPRLATGDYRLCLDVEPGDFFKVFARAGDQVTGCRRVRITEGEITVVEPEADPS